MKYLLVLLVVMLAIGVWRNGRRRVERDTPPPPPPAAPAHAPTQMLSCRQCGVHLPSVDAVQGRSGAYCSVEHRRLAEG